MWGSSPFPSWRLCFFCESLINTSVSSVSWSYSKVLLTTDMTCILSKGGHQPQNYKTNGLSSKDKFGLSDGVSENDRPASLSMARRGCYSLALPYPCLTTLYGVWLWLWYSTMQDSLSVCPTFVGVVRIFSYVWIVFLDAWGPSAETLDGTDRSCLQTPSWSTLSRVWNCGCLAELSILSRRNLWPRASLSPVRYVGQTSQLCRCHDWDEFSPSHLKDSWFSLAFPASKPRGVMNVWSGELQKFVLRRQRTFRQHMAWDSPKSEPKKDITVSGSALITSTILGTYC